MLSHDGSVANDSGLDGAVDSPQMRDNPGHVVVSSSSSSSPVHRLGVPVLLSDDDDWIGRESGLSYLAEEEHHAHDDQGGRGGGAGGAGGGRESTRLL